MKSAIRVLLLGSAVALAPLACSSKSAEEANLQENSLPDADPALDKKPAHAMATKEKATTVVEGNNCFAFDLYARLSQEKSNLFFSPHSISNALAMTYDGARGNTAIEMKNVLHFPFDQNGLDPAFADLIRQLQEGKDKAKYELVLANRLFGQKDYDFLPSFLKVQRDFYAAPLEEVDFIRATEAARKTINSWVERQTDDKIQDLIKPGILTVDTRLVLANAIYFKAAWQRPFDINRTAAEKFFVPPDNTVKVPTMHANVRANFFKTDSFSVLELPYEDRQLSMVLFLPQEVGGLADFEKQLNIANLQKWLAELTDHEVTVALPKFKLTCEFQLNEVLKTLGMRDAFNPRRADFSGMTTRDGLFISAVVHKAFIDLNEAGTEAAAATAGVIALRSLPSPGTFRADHPFVYLIKDNRTGAILFLGRVVNPI
jgi:serpin B